VCATGRMRLGHSMPHAAREGYASTLTRAGCTVQSSVRVSHLMLVAGALGVALFFTAPLLTSSCAFRLSCGTLIFTSGSLLILVVVLLRCVSWPATAICAVTHHLAASL
jgi:hypothetical protein